MSIEEDRTITIYVNNNQIQPVELKFYAGVNEADIEELIKETIENLKSSAKNPSLKLFERSTAQEVSPNKTLSKLKSLVLSSEEPKNLINYVRPIEDDAFVAEDTTNPGIQKVAGKKTFASNPNAENNGAEAGPIVIKVINYSNEGNGQVGDEAHHRKRPGSAASQVLNRSKTPKKVKKVHAGVPEDNDEANSVKNPEENKFEESKSAAPSGQVSQLVSPEKQIVEVVREIPKWITGNVATKSIDGNDPQIYSFKKLVMPFSYILGAEDKFNPKLPPPTYLSYEVISETKSYAKNDVFKGLEIKKNGEIKLVDEEVLKNQKGIVTDVLKRLASSIAEGRGVVGVSLPVRIFEPRSLLERCCDWWTFIPNYFLPALGTPDPLDRFKAVISMAMAGCYVSAKQLKPFNPLLGETYQATFPNHNIDIYMEHTSHHPPIANFLVLHKGFKFWGRYHFFAKLETNTLTLLQEGPNNVEFYDTKQHIQFFWGPLKVGGMLWGDRICKYDKFVHFIDKANKLKCVIKFGEVAPGTKGDKRVDNVYGKIYRYKPDMTPDGMMEKNFKKYAEICKTYGDLDSEICEVTGAYLSHLNIGNKEYWNIDKDVPTEFKAVENPLCSDSRYREDLIWVKRKNFKYAEEWKLKKEERQRYEKKLRVEYAKKHKKTN